MTIKLTRRGFLKTATCSSCAVAASGIIPSVFDRVAAAQSVGNGKRLLICNMAGGLDSLLVAQPVSGALQAVRPNIYMPTNSLLSLGANNIGLNPALATFKSFWDQNRLAVVVQAGLENMSESHDEAEDSFAYATRSMSNTGWVAKVGQRYFTAPHRIVDLTGGHETTAGGTYRATRVDSLSTFGLNTQIATEQGHRFDTAIDVITRASTAEAAVEATANWAQVDGSLDVIRNAASSAPTNYPQTGWGNEFREAEVSFKSLGATVVNIRQGGHDNHDQVIMALNGNNGRNGLLGRFDDALAVFVQNMGALMDDTIVIMLTEFARTTRENGNRGTDHAQAQTIVVMGGGVAGNVYGSMPSDAEINSSRNSLPMKNHIVGIYGDILKGMGFDPNAIFSNYAGKSLGLF